MHENIVVLQGWLDGQFIRESELWGVKYDHFKAIIVTTRRSGVVDVARIVIPAEVEDEVKMIMRQRTGNYTPVTCIGQLQTIKDWETGTVHLFVRSAYICKTEGYWIEKNKVLIQKGKIGKRPRKRETPLGRCIVDTTIKVRNLIGKGACYIPAVFWESELEEISQYKEGDAIAVAGRLQSRTYKKRLADGTEEERTAYELSVNSIEPLPEENEG